MLSDPLTDSTWVLQPQRIYADPTDSGGKPLEGHCSELAVSNELPRSLTPDKRLCVDWSGQLPSARNSETIGEAVLGNECGVVSEFVDFCQPTNCDVLYDLQVFWQSSRACKLS